MDRRRPSWSCSAGEGPGCLSLEASTPHTPSFTEKCQGPSAAPTKGVSMSSEPDLILDGSAPRSAAPWLHYALSFPTWHGLGKAGQPYSRRGHGVQMRSCCTRALASTRSFRITACQSDLRRLPAGHERLVLALEVGIVLDCNMWTISPAAVMSEIPGMEVRISARRSKVFSSPKRRRSSASMSFS